MVKIPVSDMVKTTVRDVVKISVRNVVRIPVSDVVKISATDVVKICVSDMVKMSVRDIKISVKGVVKISVRNMVKQYIAYLPTTDYRSSGLIDWVYMQPQRMLYYYFSLHFTHIVHLCDSYTLQHKEQLEFRFVIDM